LMRARRRPIEILACDELRVAVRPLTSVLSIASPPKRPAGTRVDSVEELLAKLRQEAKVL
jgi:electron transfer flavoprotein beta subunit